MKFGDFIKTVEKGKLKPEDLRFIGNRYYEKFNGFFRKRFHDNFDRANTLRNYPDVDSDKMCCCQLINTMKNIKFGGWLFTKCAETLNAVFDSDIRLYSGSGGEIEPKDKEEIILAFQEKCDRTFPSPRVRNPNLININRYRSSSVDTKSTNDTEHGMSFNN